jgi:hypothetical protein
MSVISMTALACCAVFIIPAIAQTSRHLVIIVLLRLHHGVAVRIECGF